MLTFTSQRLHDVTRRVFEGAGTPTDLATQMADILVEANLAGHDSHGIIRIPAYVDAIHKGSIVAAARPEVIQETPGSALVDGKYAFGHIAAAYATDVAVRKAKGVIAIVTVGGSGGPGAAAPFGGAARALSTNPISVGMPSGERPDMLVDFATTAVAEGKIQVARAKKAPLPPGCILDKDGNPSTNPEDFYNGGMLLPFGGHKGYALAMVVEMLGAALTPGQQYNHNGHGGGAVIIAVDAATFRPRDEYEQAADATLGRIKDIPPARGFSEVLLPGEPELRSKAERLGSGIPVAEATWEAIIKAGQTVGVTVE